jgi:hypothetical protein
MTKLNTDREYYLRNVHTHTFVHTYMTVHTISCTQVYRYVHICVHTHTYTQAFLHTSVRTHMCTHAYLHTSILAHRHTCTQAYQHNNVYQSYRRHTGVCCNFCSNYTAFNLHIKFTKVSVDDEWKISGKVVTNIE